MFLRLGPAVVTFLVPDLRHRPTPGLSKVHDTRASPETGANTIFTDCIQLLFTGGGQLAMSPLALTNFYRLS